MRFNPDKRDYYDRWLDTIQRRPLYYRLYRKAYYFVKGLFLGF